MLSGQRLGSVPGGKRETKYVREPRDSTLSWTNLLSPWMIAAIEITDETPMTIPKMVRAERTFAERSVARAARKFSRACDDVMMAISQTSARQSDQDLRRGTRDKFRRTI